MKVESRNVENNQIHFKGKERHTLNRAGFNARIYRRDQPFTFVFQTGGPISKVGEVRPKIADAAVETMGQQLLQRESLTWHLGSITDKDKQHLALR